MAKLEPENKSLVGRFVLDITHTRMDTIEEIEKKEVQRKIYEQNSVSVLKILGVRKHADTDTIELDEELDNVFVNRNMRDATHLMIPHEFMIADGVKWDLDKSFDENYQQYDDDHKERFTNYIFGHASLANLMPGKEKADREDLFHLYAKITTDMDSRREFIDNAAEMLSSINVRIAETDEILNPDSHEIIVHEDTEHDTYVIIPEEINCHRIQESDREDLADSIGGYYFARCR